MNRVVREREVGQLLETLRIAQGWTPAQLEEQTGIRQGTLSRYENGLRQPQPDAVEVLATVFA